MSNAERKQYVDDIIEGIHRQGKNNILYNGVKAGYYFELDNPQTQQKEKYVSEVVNKDGNSIGFIIDKKQNEDGEVVFTIRDGLGKDREMTLQEVYKQAEGGGYANNPILFTKVDDIYDYLTEQAGEDVELRTEIETRKLLSYYIQTQEDGSRVVRIAQLSDGSTMFVRAENEQAGTITGLVVTENGYKVEQRSIKEVESIGNRDADQIISNSANIFASSIETDANIDIYTNNEYERVENNNEVEQIETEGNDQTQEEKSDNRNPREREHKLRERTEQQVENIYNQEQETKEQEVTETENKNNDEVRLSESNNQEKEPNETEQQVENIYNQEQETKEQEEVSKEKKYKLSEQTDDNGLCFVKSSNGGIDFGEITADKGGLMPAPIRLSEGFNKNTKGGKNVGYGLEHIEAGHGEQIRQAGFNSVVEFIEDVAKNYTTIRKGNKRNNKQDTYILEVKDKNNNTLFIELSKDGKYWTINSAGIFREDYSKNKSVVWSLPALENDSTVGTAGVQNQNKNGNSLSGNSPQTTDLQGKGTIKNGNE